MSEILLRKIIETPHHHAHLIVGNRDVNYEQLRLVIREKVETNEIHSADVWSRIYESTTIDDAREIKEVQSTKPIGERRIVLVSLSSIQSEAQNSLLKLFEEPASQTMFIICAGTTDIFLPTLLSRFSILEIKNDVQKKDIQNLVSQFLKSPIGKRFELIEDLVKEKDKVQTEHFLNGLEFSLHNQKQINSTLFENIFSARRYIRSRSPSLKMILENLCVTVPVIS